MERADGHASARRARTVAAVVATLSLLAVAVTGLLLGWRYRPEGSPEPGYVSSSHRLVGAHQLVMTVAFVTVAIWCVLVIRGSLGRESRGRGILVIVTSIVALLLTVLTAFTWNLVHFEQVALWAVTVGHDHQGLVWAAFDDQVRFILVDGAEVSPTTFATWVVVHLAAPWLALACIAVASLATRDEVASAQRRSRPTGTSS